MEWKYVIPGIPDNFFERDEEIPMTKEEIRALALSKLRIRKGDMILDIGCGTGSVTVEASLLVGSTGKVYGVDKEEKAINLTRRNAEKFGVLNNIVLIKGEAPEILFTINEKFDRIFIGGGSEKIKEIISASWEIIKKGGRVVIDAILLETVNNAISAMENIGFMNLEITEVIIAKGMKTKVGTAMMTRNPIFIISGEKQ
ncbi:precorrin-6Y C5,15-methyltransferase (decarboxylating), CbiT subunit [Sulfolobus islandicus Y.G.57.14]|uniref:Probable cobalt-precorrin-6B C(15)-methyltransferase (decarboxylating) n=9 Tax=Saccharolobus islandicus TaxID=43080 RepID=CBIT_SACI2|nr:precorrin-6Y C5,15-methyltransferase (decarboxylating) subunit CbiT [Sulfolobus islandicus]C3MJI5.1 RecName: Full=Probable cobalt-precorrin-6B C(15)-methyltransferase (decarboxylating) [Sulfolobus islandicus L.S.2.15]C3MTW8.1 RecName: Full=Probable cobalt-precorrin-6B C(15)-methyltransferase (decarboxylating) [Sulfolobus islandicus M.14.25]C3N0H8.1 RecName: Full=Probable cobalt-precorrin-6B C(15)-methyltransferase (decarboxylating) [Sulfolobus islandicus M.16.27]C3N8G6.1 RecName: Full=Probab